MTHVHTLGARSCPPMLPRSPTSSCQLLLALFPFVIFLLALLGALGLPELFDQLLDQARPALPPDAYQLVVRVIGEIRGQPREGLLSVSILFSLWAASAELRSISNALNVAYDVAETRSVYVTPVSVVGVSTWIVASLGFSAYVDNFGIYGATYGSLGGMEVLLLYFFVSAAVLLFGAEINATIHPAVPPARAGRGSAVETTVCEEPMRAT
jgi:uncharacterized BrkB/YihY/UPF0761 family membrane protein